MTYSSRMYVPVPVPGRCIVECDATRRDGPRDVFCTCTNSGAREPFQETRKQCLLVGSKWRNSDLSCGAPLALATQAPLSFSFGPNVLQTSTFNLATEKLSSRRINSYFDYPLLDMPNRKSRALKEPSYIYAFYKWRFMSVTIEFPFSPSWIKSTCFK